ncbi:hypothetical protein [Rhodomicrobium lacus]|uniref:hypothetical protein n=1 Tax=Rhodomicrobium lacus TaxID=2498452 RepID=UPI0026E32731|nr:hypothetical protein [Rhodomicrobium lacus]WKW51244.1 hypothetical protein QMO75_01735 [Rhodomicrobium lacus]
MGKIPSYDQPELPFNAGKLGHPQYFGDIRKLEKPRNQKCKAKLQPDETSASAALNINSINISINNHQPTPPIVAKEDIPAPSGGRISEGWFLGRAVGAVNQVVEKYLAAVVGSIIIAVLYFLLPWIAGSHSQVGSWTTISIPAEKK